ncbi:hypothetical protein [Ruminiclostridium josui]|uniref:hypothetical protein n=1 Tax=Ruminiclostridium josui TaxID=1499 RepID=UPI0004646404|nr:hypothetical protein [Ruminiclostridium josui]
MGEGCGFTGASVGKWDALLANYIGQTVTIFTSSGGESGSGFTGVLLTVNNVFVRLITRIGPSPGCSLGNACTGFNSEYGHGSSADMGIGCGSSGGYGMGPVLPASINGAAAAGGWDSLPVYTVGSVTDIPVASIVSFVHNAV